DSNCIAYLCKSLLVEALKRFSKKRNGGM
nr:hypothetical protein [Tanacetum cinerariifolium]